MCSAVYATAGESTLYVSTSGMAAKPAGGREAPNRERAHSSSELGVWPECSDPTPHNAMLNARPPPRHNARKCSLWYKRYTVQGVCGEALWLWDGSLQRLVLSFYLSVLPGSRGRVNSAACRSVGAGAAAPAGWGASGTGLKRGGYDRSGSTRQGRGPRSRSCCPAGLSTQRWSGERGRRTRDRLCGQQSCDHMPKRAGEPPAPQAKCRCDAAL